MHLLPFLAVGITPQDLALLSGYEDTFAVLLAKAATDSLPSDLLSLPIRDGKGIDVVSYLPLIDLELSFRKRSIRRLVSAAHELLRCIVPAFDGAYFSEREKEALWDRFFTGAPRRQRRSVERYNIVKRA
jgi:hypothetical protein